MGVGPDPAHGPYFADPSCTGLVFITQWVHFTKWSSLPGLLNHSLKLQTTFVPMSVTFVKNLLLKTERDVALVFQYSKSNSV